jgi:hypothetical protein
VFFLKSITPPTQNILDDRGWTDRQLPDGTVIWKSPTGKTYVAKTSNRGVMMPRRQRTRAADRTRRILEERALNDAYVAERNRPPPF